MTIRIVTDSACDLPDHLAAEYNIKVVPVYVNIGNASYLEGVELSREEFYRELPDYEVYPTTAAPSAGAFSQVYQDLLAEGATEILSIHISSKLSATLNAARVGAESVPGASITLFDTEQITLGAGLLVLMAAEAVAAGSSMPEVVSMLQQHVDRARVFGMINDLTSLRKSGRVSWTEFGLGTLLQIKPVMMIHQGEISVQAKIRTRKRAVSEMLAMVKKFGPFEKLAVIHVGASDEAEDLRRQARHLFPQDRPQVITNISPAIGTHLGLGAVGFACIGSTMR